MADASKELKIVINGDTSGAESALGKIGTIVAGLGIERLAEEALNAGKELVESTISAFANYQDQLAQLDTRLKSTHDASGMTRQALVDLSETLQSQTTFSNDAVLSTENLLLTFTKIGKDTFPEATQAVLDMSIALGQDTKNSAIQLGKALQDPILGVTALRRVGVDFDEQAKKQIETMVKQGNLLEAQKFILKEINTEFGGSAAAAATTYNGKMQQLNNTIDDVKKGIGKLIVEAMFPFINAIKPVLDMLVQVVDGKKQMSDVIAVLLKQFPQLAGLIAGLQIAFKLISDEIRTLFTPIMQQLQDLYSKHKQAIDALAQALGVILVGAIVVVIAGIAAFLEVVVQETSAILNFVEVCGKALGDFFYNVYALIQTAQNFFTGLGDTVFKVMSGIISSVKGMVNSVIDDLNRLISAFNNVASKLPGGLKLPTIPNVKASGGFASGLTLVGEMGPELVNLPPGSYVNNAASTRSMNTAPQISVVFNNPVVRSDNDIQEIIRQVEYVLGRKQALAQIGAF